MKLKTFTFLAFLGSVLLANAANIPTGFEVTPADGAVISELKEISIYLKYDEDIYSYPTPKITINGKSIGVTSNTSGDDFDLLTWTLKEPITEPGEYEIVVGAESFFYGYYETDNVEMSWKFTIEGSASDYKPNIPAAFEVTPAHGSTISELTQITVLYKEGSDIYNYTPKITLNGQSIRVYGQTSGDSDNLLTWTLIEPVTEPGEYEIVVASASFFYGLYEEDSPEMSWKFTIEGGTTPDDPEFEPYENKDVTIYPEQGKYTAINEFTLTFSNVTLPDINYLKSASLINDATNEVVATGKASEGSIIQQMVIDLDKVITEPGTYTLLVPEGMFYDGGSWDEEDLPEMKFRYVVSADGTEIKPAEYIVEANPADGSNVSSIESIILTYPEFDAIYKHEEKDIRIENAAGETVATGKFSYGNTEANQMLIKFTPEVTEQGDYTVIIPKRAFSLGDMKFTVFSSEVVLKYHVTGVTAIDKIEVSDLEGKPVYNVLGIKVADSLNNLPAGLYICNGRKFIVR